MSAIAKSLDVYRMWVPVRADELAKLNIVNGNSVKNDVLLREALERGIRRALASRRAGSAFVEYMEERTEGYVVSVSAGLLKQAELAARKAQIPLEIYLRGALLEGIDLVDLQQS